MLTALTSSVNRQSDATMPLQFILPTVNGSADLTSETNGLPLSSCFWSRTVRGHREIVTLENGVIHDPVDGVSYQTDKLIEGQCGVSISSIQGNHYGQWSCTLVATEGQVLSGTVDVRGNELQNSSPTNPIACSLPSFAFLDSKAQIYYATYGDGLKDFSTQTSEIHTLLSSSEEFYGVAYDTMRNMLYWSNASRIYRCSASDWRNVETVLSTSQC